MTHLFCLCYVQPEIVIFSDTQQTTEWTVKVVSWHPWEIAYRLKFYNEYSLVHVQNANCWFFEFSKMWRSKWQWRSGDNTLQFFKTFLQLWTASYAKIVFVHSAMSWNLMWLKFIEISDVLYEYSFKMIEEFQVLWSY